MFVKETKENVLLKYDKYLEKLVKYAEKELGVLINLHSNSFCYDVETQTINCTSKLHGDLRFLCYLLHELGHHNQPDSVFHYLPRNGKKKIQCIVIEQEYFAWKIGWEIALFLEMEDLWDTYIKEWMYSWHHYLNNINKFAIEELRDLKSAYPASNIHPFTGEEYEK